MPRILIAEDDLSSRDFLCTLLGYYGYELTIAGNGRDALNAARSVRPDLIISDILMPGMDGYSFIRELRDEPNLAATPVIFWSAVYHEPAARLLAEDCGVLKVLLKPAMPGEILRAVDAALLQSFHAPPPQPTQIPSQDQFRNDHWSLLNSTLAGKVSELESLNQGLLGLADSSRQLTSERDPVRLLKHVLEAARNILRGGEIFLILNTRELAESAVAIARRDDGLLPSETDACLALERASWTGPVTVEEFSARVEPLSCADGLRNDGCVTIAPLRTPEVLYGLICCAHATDEPPPASAWRMATMLAAHAAVCVENLLRFHALEEENRERARAEERIRQMNQEIHAINASLEIRILERTGALEAANRQLETFSYSVSHDLRSPLALILSYLDVLFDDYQEQLPEAAVLLLKRMSKSGQRMSELIDNLLRLSRGTKQPLKIEHIEMDELVRQIAGELLEREPGRIVDLSISPLVAVSADRSLMAAAVTNLLSNAIKYTRGRERALIEIGNCSVSAELRFFFRDNGAGFDAGDAGKLFCAFQRLHSPSQFEGHGVGLAIVRQIVERHGGRVWAQGDRGAGATFWFALPSASVSQGPQRIG